MSFLIHLAFSYCPKIFLFPSQVDDGDPKGLYSETLSLPPFRRRFSADLETASCSNEHFIFPFQMQGFVVWTQIWPTSYTFFPPLRSLRHPNAVVKRIESEVDFLSIWALPRHEGVWTKYLTSINSVSSSVKREKVPPIHAYSTGRLWRFKNF